MKVKVLLLSTVFLASSILSGVEIVKDSFRVVFRKDIKPEDAKKVSETGILPGKSQSFRLPDSMIYDLKNLFKNPVPKEDRAVISFKIISERDCQRLIGLSADYWFTCYINGVMIGTTEPSGELFYPINPYNRGFKVTLKKGVNHVALHTRSGSGSWNIACRFFPDVSEWPDNQRDRDQVYSVQFPVPEKIIGPEVTKVSADSALILYYKEIRDSIFITYWKKDTPQKKKTICESYIYGRIPQKNLFRFELKNLDSDREYCYELRSITPGSKVISGTFRTAPAKGFDHTLVAISDTQTYYDLRADLIRRMVRKGFFKGADLLVSLGDVNSEFTDFERTYFETFLTPFREEGVTVPFYPVRGNHEYRGTATDRYTDWFGCPYYAFRYGDVFYIVVDTGEDKASRTAGHPYTLWTETTEYFKAQREWLQRVIKTEACQSAKYRIVLAHAAPFEWEKSYYAMQIAKFADCFLGKNPECRIDLWLCGDVHCPYRFDPATGEVYGAKRKFTKKKRGIFTKNDLRNIHFPVYVNDGPGGTGQNFSVTRIEVRKDSLLVTCTGEDGSVMDQIVIRPGLPFKVLQSSYEKYVPYSGSR